MKKRISERVLAKLKPGETVWDTEQLGFGARRRKTGVFFVFKVQRRRRAEWVPLGKYGAVTVDQARESAARERGAVTAGGRAGAWRLVPTLEEFGKRFLEQVEKPSTKRSYELQLRLYLNPVLGHRRLDEIITADVTRLRERMKRRGLLGSFNNARRVLSAMLNKAMVWGDMPERRNPCVGVAGFTIKRPERFLSEQELSRLGTALATFEENGSPADPDGGLPAVAPATAKLVAAVIRLLIFTGARHNEIRELRWDEVASGVLQKRQTKTGAQAIALNPPAAQILASLPRRGELVFESPTWPGHIVDLHAGWQAVRRLAKLEDGIRLHDLRHSFASVSVAAGQSLYLTGALLGHRSSKTTERYAHLSADPVAKASANVARRIEAAMNAREDDESDAG